MTFSPFQSAVLGLAVTAAPLVSQQAPRLGTIDFPATGAAVAHPAFVRGVLYLHSFEYAAAITAFREAQRLDPRFVMAYWGEALSFTHPVWNQQDRDSALLALGRLAPTREARLALARTPRERGYLVAVEILYGEGSKARRDTLYSRAMLQLMNDHPADHEARTFAALSLLGLSQSVRDVPAYMRAAAIAAPVFAANPDHPGAAHYLIHAFDDPIHATLGLPSARAYSRIAPDAAHAQHMTTHIFLALGMWDETISQNVIAANQTAYLPGHYTMWLAYGYVQAGRYRDGTQLLERVRTGMRRPGQRGTLAVMRAGHVIDTEDWGSAMWGWPDMNLEGLMPMVRVTDHFGRGFAAARRGDLQVARAASTELSRLADSLRTSDDTLLSRKSQVMALELRGVLSERDEALTILRQAATLSEALPMDFGPPEIVKPAWELLGEALLQYQRPADAQRAFTRALELAPGRARSLIGLVRSAAAAGDHAVAGDTYRMLLASWHAADAGLPVLAELRPLIASR